MFPRPTFRSMNWGLFLTILAGSFPVSAFADETPLAQTSEEDILVTTIGDYPLELDLFVPVSDALVPLAIFIHGGGWLGGSRKNLYVDWLLDHGYAVASLSYRLSSQAIFPAQLEDCQASIRWLRAHARERGVDPDRFAVLGTSAGGYLALMLGVTGNEASFAGEGSLSSEGSARVQAVVSYWGPSDFPYRSTNQPQKTESPEGSVYRLLGGAVSEDLARARRASPVSHVDSEDPPLLLIHGAEDQTVFLDQSERMYQASLGAGVATQLVVSPDGGHGGVAFSDARFKESVLAFLRRTLHERE